MKQELFHIFILLLANVLIISKILLKSNYNEKKRYVNQLQAIEIILVSPESALLVYYFRGVIDNNR